MSRENYFSSVHPSRFSVVTSPVFWTRFGLWLITLNFIFLCFERLFGAGSPEVPGSRSNNLRRLQLFGLNRTFRFYKQNTCRKSTPKRCRTDKGTKYIHICNTRNSKGVIVRTVLKRHAATQRQKTTFIPQINTSCFTSSRTST